MKRMKDLERQYEWLRSRTLGSGQDEHGNDTTAIAANLELTPQERIDEALRARAFALEVKRAGEAAGLRKPDKSPD